MKFVGPARVGLAAVAPGVALASLVAIVARLIGAVSPPVISEVPVAVALGLVIGHWVPLPSLFSPGLRLAMKRFLRTGIALLGAQLSFAVVLQLGVSAVGIIVALAAGTLLLVGLLARALRLEARPALLIAIGTAICGNTAILAAAPIIAARDRDVTFAVGVITLFGTMAVLMYPVIGGALALDPTVFGYWAGTAVNDTSQVVATGFAYGERSGEVATVVKLTRNLLLAPVLFLIAVGWPRAERRAEPRVPRYAEAVPVFVLGFIGMALLNSVGAFDAQLSGRGLSAWFGDLARLLVLIALAGVGLSTRLSALRAVGIRYLYLGLLAALALAGTSLVLVSRFAPGP